MVFLRSEESLLHNTEILRRLWGPMSIEKVKKIMPTEDYIRPPQALSLYRYSVIP